MATPAGVASRERLAVIVPVLDDWSALKRLLAHLESCTGVDETVVSTTDVPNNRDDIVNRKFPLRWVTGAAGRGLQLNRGAEHTDAQLLWFLHADATPPANGASLIRSAANDGAEGGYFKFRFEGVESRGAQRLAALINWRARRGVPYGDQGLWFTRDAFDDAGGFDNEPLFEEVRLVKAIRERGSFREMAESIGVDPRRWQQTGWIRRTLTNRALALAHGAGVAPTTLARWYRMF